MLFPESIDKYISEDNQVRIIEDIVNKHLVKINQEIWQV